MLENYTRGLLVGSLAVAVSACAGYAQRDLGAGRRRCRRRAARQRQRQHDTTASVVGTIGDAGVDEHVGRQDQAAMARTFEATPTGETNRWSNDASGISYAVIPERTYYTRDDDRTCREFTLKIRGRDGDQRVKETACRQSSGDWAIGSRTTA